MTNRLTLTTPDNSEDEVAIGSDTSGFLAAAGLASSNTVRGNIRDDRQTLATTTQFGSVASGSFTINGVSIAVNRDTDTLSTLIVRINDANAGVTAAYDATADKLVLAGTSNSEDLIAVAGDTSGFLSAAHLATGNTVRGHLSEDTVAFHNLSRFSSVTAGSFVVDGRTISVSTSDTIQSIVARINDSGARVTAAFDATANKLTLTTTDNTEDEIAIGSDSSGFLAAAGLASSNTVKGNIRDDRQTLAKTTQFGAVASGSFTINGVSIAVDRDTDTLSTLITRINSANAGVTAAYDASADKLVLTGTSNSEDLIAVAGDTSGFLSAAHLATGNTVRGHLSEDTVAFHNLSRFSSVTAGSFVVDGRTISVSTSDTIQSIAARINGSGARVTAAFDATANKLTLTTTDNSEDDVAIGSDTSGFLAAAGLASSNTVRGNIRDDRQTLAETTQFGAVASGSFTINDVSIAVDRDTDTLSTLIARINGANAGVTAAYDATGDKLILTGASNSQDLIRVGNDTSGFLAAAHLDTANTGRGHLREDSVALANVGSFQSVRSGSFVIDGRTIEIDTATDTVLSVVARINASGARVTASYDDSADRVVLQATYDSEDDVPIGSDGTGFLAAAHLAGGNTVRGNIRDDRQVLSKTSQFAAVTSGSFQVNGRTIAIDREADTIGSILGRINDAGAGVTATLNATTNRIELVGTSDSEDLIEVGGDTTDFLAAAQLAAGNTVRGNLRDDRQVLAKTSQFRNVVSGSFAINGRTISVDAERDTLATLVDRINGAGAGVTAALNTSTDRIELVGTAASEDLIAVGNDTTGFLAAAGLHSGNTTRGNIADDRQALAATSRFATVSSGSFDVNGVTIAVDAGTDTLQSVIARINSAGTGVTASYDADADRLVVRPNAVGATLSLENDTSGFLAAAAVATGTVGTRVRTDAAFNGNSSRSPLFDPGVAVPAGTFTVNGTTVTVDADDTVDRVLAKITASDAGVAASFDQATQTVRLTATKGGGAPVIVGDDTSGFLAAVKLDTANKTSVTVRVNAPDVALEDVAQYAGVTAGTLSVSGHLIAIDPAATTLRGLLSSLNEIANISATFDAGSGQIRISGSHQGDTIELSDTSGLLSALGIAEGTHRGRAQVTTAVQVLVGTTAATRIDPATRAAAAVARLNNVLSQLRSGDDAQQARPELKAATERAIQALIEAGIDGVSVSEDGEPRLAFEDDRWAGALDPAADATTRGATASALLDDVVDQTFAPKPPLEPTSASERAAVVQQLVTQAAAGVAGQNRLLIESLTRNLVPAPAGKPVSTSITRKSGDKDAAKSLFEDSDDPLSLFGRFQPPKNRF